MSLLTHRTLALVAVSVGQVSCAARIRAAYEQSRAEALADPGAAPQDWTPDAQLGMSWELVTSLAVRELTQRLEDPSARLVIDLPLGAQARLEPDLELTDARMSPVQDCAACVRIGSRFSGALEWSVGNLGGEVPLAFDLDAVLGLATRKVKATEVVEAQLRNVTIRFTDMPSVERLRLDLDDPLARWIRQQVEQDFPTIPIAELGSDDLPVRALRLSTSPDHLLAQVLTSSPVRSGAALPDVGDADWVLAMDQQALLGLARRAAFEQGELDYQIHADPWGLAIEQQRFRMDLRLWRLAGACWWRDYEVLGELRLEDGHLRLAPDAVHERDHSRGAGIVDPLALLGRGVILSAIEESLDVARPAEVREPIGGATLVLAVEQARGVGQALVLEGRGDLTEGKRDRGKPRKPARGEGDPGKGGAGGRR